LTKALLSLLVVLEGCMHGVAAAVAKYLEQRMAAAAAAA